MTAVEVEAPLLEDDDLGGKPAATFIRVKLTAGTGQILLEATSSVLIDCFCCPNGLSVPKPLPLSLNRGENRRIVVISKFKFRCGVQWCHWWWN